MEKKITKMQKFEMLSQLAEVKSNPMLIEFIEHEMDLLAKKNSGERKPTATQKANATLKQGIVQDMTMKGEFTTITDMTKTFPSCMGLSAPKVSAMVSQLVKEGLVQRIEVKRRAYFGLTEWNSADFTPAE